MINAHEFIQHYALRHTALGVSLPPSPHSIFCSLPKISDVTAYEKGNIDIKKKMQGGYPRFVNPRFTARLEELLLDKLLPQKSRNKKTISSQAQALAPLYVRLLSSVNVAERLQSYLGRDNDFTIHDIDGLCAISCSNDSGLVDKIQNFLQHTGVMLFSREAERHLMKYEELGEVYPEQSYQENENEKQTAKEYLSNHIAQDIETSPNNIFLARCGMNAMYAAYYSLSQIQKQKKRKLWIQLGWLYIDTVKILKKLCDSAHEYIYFSDHRDLKKLQEFLATRGDEVAGIITETPTNPLMQTPNIIELSSLCKKAGAALILDPSMVGIQNVSILPYCDVLVCSLTKYYGWSGDIIMGFSAVNPASSFYTELHSSLSKHSERPYQRDIERLAFLLPEQKSVCEKINQNTLRVVKYLQQNPAVKKIYWAYAGEENSKNYQVIAKNNQSPGGVISFELKGSMIDFYDSIAMPKGPSFGLAFSLLCPYIYLAHYDLTQNEQGRKELSSSNLNPNILRLSIGIEDADRICATIEDALNIW